jgi:Fic-DOC domain mobile mystery protein B
MTPPVKVIFGDLLPGETPIDDASGLLVADIQTRAQLSVVEAENIFKTLIKYLGEKPTVELAPFHLAWSKELHREMYGDVWAWAGEFRNKDFNFGVKWPLVQEKMHNLLEDLGMWKSSGMPLVEQAARLHHGAVSIHPFVNGNGRWSRMLTNIWLKLHDSPDVAWPEQLIGSNSPVRGEYIDALKKADAGDIDEFIAMHARLIRPHRAQAGRDAYNVGVKNAPKTYKSVQGEVSSPICNHKSRFSFYD